jgi:hypothetical protein
MSGCRSSITSAIAASGEKQSVSMSNIPILFRKQTVAVNRIAEPLHQCRVPKMDLSSRTAFKAFCERYQAIGQPIRHCYIHSDQPSASLDLKEDATAGSH